MQCHFDWRNFPISKPGFLQRMPECMVHSHRKGKCSCEDIMKKLVWNNKYILNDGKSLYYAFFTTHVDLAKSKI